MSIFLGFDTSNYTTSVAAVDDEIIYSERKILDVREGQRGLRQSEAVFAHMKALPALYEKLVDDIDISRVKAVGVSIKPRNAEGSYMPVFLAGEGYAEVAAKSLKVPVYRFSHQDGHIMAGILSGKCRELLKKEFLSVHLSGGTTEILKSRYNGYCFDNEIVGGTKDISAGQLIDRVGVKMGMKFPCGREIEKAAEKANGNYIVKTSVSGGFVNFSGAETSVIREIGRHDLCETAYAVLFHVADALCRMLNNIIEDTRIKDILIVGGVASNSIIKEILNKNVHGKLYYALPEYSADNAVGIAALAEKGGV